MRNPQEPVGRREFQVVGTFFLLLGAGLVLDRAAPALGWILVVGATVLLAAAHWGSARGLPPTAETEPTSNQAGTWPPSTPS